MLSPPLHELIIDHLSEAGFDTQSWQYTKSWGFKRHYMSRHRWLHRYIIVPGLYRMLIVDKGKGEVYIKLVGIPGFEIEVSILDPSSLTTLEKTLVDLYAWMKNITPECLKGLQPECLKGLQNES